MCQALNKDLIPELKGQRVKSNGMMELESVVDKPWNNDGFQSHTYPAVINLDVRTKLSLTIS